MILSMLDKNTKCDYNNDIHLSVDLSKFEPKFNLENYYPYEQQRCFKTYSVYIRF
jgi:hypothetical protein